jgi:hypothetical protein
MKWIVKVIVEAAPGQNIEHEIVTLDRPDLLSPANVSLSIAEGKTIPESLQTQMVAAQVERSNVSVRCSSCGKAFSHKRLLPVHSAFGLRECAYASATLARVFCTGAQNRSYSTIFTNNNPITPELRYLNAKMFAFLPFGQAADFLRELLPVSANMTASTVRNRTMKVGKRLQKSADALSVSSKAEPREEVVVGLDGGYVRARHPRPERNFEVVVGKVFDPGGNATRFAFVRNGGLGGGPRGWSRVPPAWSQRKHFDHCSYRWRRWTANNSPPRCAAG